MPRNRRRPRTSEWRAKTLETAMLNKATVAVAAVIIFGTAFAVQAGSKDDAGASGGFDVGPLGQPMGGPPSWRAVPPGAPSALAYYGGYDTSGYGAYGYSGYGAFASAPRGGCSASSGTGIVCDGRCWMNISNGN